jgi:hypothetical protein
MPTRSELKRISAKRLQEAKLLATKRHYDGAAYLLGYVIETALKARICKLLEVEKYPDTGDYKGTYFTHKLEVLLTLAGLRAKFDTKKVASAQFFTNWSLVLTWNESLRYQPIGTVNRQQVRNLINAIEDPVDGILTWIKTLW